MSDNPATHGWKLHDIDRMLEVLQAIGAPGFKICEGWGGGLTEDASGETSFQIPYPVYHPVVAQFQALVYETSAQIDAYAPLPEDPTQNPIPFSVLGTHFTPEYFDTATLNQIRRYLMLCSRGERFCDGHIEGEFVSGSLLAALQRLQHLRQQMGEKPAADTFRLTNYAPIAD